MTEKLYYKNQYTENFTATVMSCTQKEQKFEIELDKTVFFPEGGGQPGDTGFIDGVEVLDTIERDGIIYHICSAPLEVGKQAEGRLDFEKRFDRMQQHTGEHIFSGFVHSVCGYENVGFHMGEKSVTVDFNGKISGEQLQKIERLSNEAIYKNIPVQVLYPSDDELKNYEYRSKKEIRGQVRLVKIEGVDLCACCGTHTALTGEVGIIKAVSMMNYKSGVRITLLIGKRAVEDYGEKNASAVKISNLLCVKTDEVAQGVEKILSQLHEEKSKNIALKKELFSLRCENMSGDVGVLFDDEGSADNARILCDMLAEKLKIAAVFSGSDDSGYKYAVASRSEDVRPVGKALNAACSGRGGGKPEMIQGSVTAAENVIKEFFASRIMNNSQCTIHNS